MRCGETKVIHRIVGNSERMKVDLANAEILARIDLDHAVAQGIGAPAWLVAGNIASLANVSIAGLR